MVDWLLHALCYVIDLRFSITYDVESVPAKECKERCCRCSTLISVKSWWFQATLQQLASIQDDYCFEQTHEGLQVNVCRVPCCVSSDVIYCGIPIVAGDNPFKLFQFELTRNFWLVVWNCFFFSIYWGCLHPN